MYASFFLNLIKGMNGTLNISLSGPSGIAAEPAFQTLFIADTDNHRVISYPTENVVVGGNSVILFSGY